MLDWVRQQQGVEISAMTLQMAALGGETAMCEHLRSIGCDWNADACNYAAVARQVDTLHWLRQNGCPCKIRNVCSNASRYGNINILNYVNEQCEVMSTDLLTKSLLLAGVYNQLETVQWLRQRGAQWPAVLSKRVGAKLMFWKDDVLTWARVEGCTAPVTLQECVMIHYYKALLRCTTITHWGNAGMCTQCPYTYHYIYHKCYYYTTLFVRLSQLYALYACAFSVRTVYWVLLLGSGGSSTVGRYIRHIADSKSVLYCTNNACYHYCYYC
jgi:hypothetical protein